MKRRAKRPWRGVFFGPAVLIAAGTLFAVTLLQAAENVAKLAVIKSSSEHSDAYQARFVADGVVPEAESRKDVGKA